MNNIVLILVDRLRYDYIKGVDSLESDICTNLSLLMRNGISANKCFSNGAPTMMSLASIYTSTMPLDDGGYDFDLKDRKTNIFNILYENGYECYNFCHPLGEVETNCDKVKQKVILNEHEEINFYKSNIVFWVTETFRIKQGYLKLVRRCKREANKLKKFGNSTLNKKISSSIAFPFLIASLIVSRIFEKIKREKAASNNLIVKISNKYRRCFENKYIENITKIYKEFFDYNVKFAGKSANKILSEVLMTLNEEKNKKNFFLVHLFDVHEDNFLSYDIENTEQLEKEIEIVKKLEELLTLKGMSKEKIKYMLSIFYVDKQLGVFLKKLEEMNLLHDTLLVINSDHGRDFKQDKRNEEHIAKDFFDEYYHVPLIFYNPNLEHKIISKICSSIDIIPTILDITGLNNRYNLKGLNILTEEFVKEEYVLMENTGRGLCNIKKKTVNLSIRNNTIKLVYRSLLKESFNKKFIVEIYDLKSDPHEVKNMIFLQESILIPESLINILQERFEELKVKYIL